MSENWLAELAARSAYRAAEIEAEEDYTQAVRVNFQGQAL